MSTATFRVRSQYRLPVQCTVVLSTADLQGPARSGISPSMGAGWLGPSARGSGRSSNSSSPYQAVGTRLWCPPPRSPGHVGWNAGCAGQRSHQWISVASSASSPVTWVGGCRDPGSGGWIMPGLVPCTLRPVAKRGAEAWHSRNTST